MGAYLSASALLLWLHCALSAPMADKITSLPGLGEPSTPEYSGYLDVDSGQGKIHLHYWLTTSQSATPDKDPVVLWMNGGPGASSVVFGFFGELGPYFMDDDSMKNKTTPGVPDLKSNPYAWNTIANVLFLESPANVGYSYCENPECRWDDKTGAEANYDALLKFFDKFPEFKDNEFYITGESYGGMYVPSLVEQIHSGKSGAVNLKGFAVGNGIIGHADTFPGQNSIHYEMLHNHGFLSEVQWAALDKECSAAFAQPGKANYTDACQTLLTKASATAGKFYVYDIYDTCGADQMKTTGTLEDFEAALRLGQPGGGPGVEPAYSPYGCGKNRVTEIYLNLPQVRDALHVKFVPSALNPTGKPDYEGNTYKYWHPGQNNTGWNYNQSRMHLLDVYPELIASYRTLIFNGDFDACVPYLHNERWTRHLADEQGWKTVREWQAWQMDEQVAGYVTTFGNDADVSNFTFATVKGSGHMVPQFQPKRGLELFRSFVTGTAPLY